MDWLHCNSCFTREGQKFAVSNCGHLTCENCLNPKQCNVCNVSCKYLTISDKMKPQEQAFFSDPVKLIQTRLEHISQIALFQRRQKDRVSAHYKQKSEELEKRLKEVMEQSYREVSELKKENAELKKQLSQRRTSPGVFQVNRMSRPVAITSPVTPGFRFGSSTRSSSGGSLERGRSRQSALAATPASVTSMSSLSSLREPGFWTPNTSMGTALRSGSVTPTSFHLQFGSTPVLQSPLERRSLHPGSHLQN